MANSKEPRDQISKLEGLATKVLLLKRESLPRRPLVIEFCGSPKAGKSSCISSLNIFLKRNGFKTKVLTERASVCPIPDKFDPLFNVWTACSAIAELAEFLATAKTQIDVIISDRGIFDALCWFEWQYEHGHLDEEDRAALEHFLTMKKWRSCIDLVCVFVAEPHVSMEREYAFLLTRKQGSVMNSDILREFTESVRTTCERHEGVFRKLELIDTTTMQQNAVSYDVTKRILDALQEITMERIGYFKAQDVTWPQARDRLGYTEFYKSQLQMQFGTREVVERDISFVQPIPIVVFTTRARDRILVFKKKLRSLSKGSPESSRLIIYAGGHIREEDSLKGKDEPLLSIARQAISREANEELGIAYYPSEGNPLCIWVRNHPTSVKHMAICFLCEVDVEHFTFSLNENEFIQRTGTSQSGQFISLAEVSSQAEALDSWSILILGALFDLKVAYKQLPLELPFE